MGISPQYSLIYANKKMNDQVAFIGFGEVNTPKELITNKCEAAVESLRDQGLDCMATYPITDDPNDQDAKKAIRFLENQLPDVIIVCIAGWIPSHTVIKVIEPYRHIPMVLWGLSGYFEEGRLVTTADQAGTTALRSVFESLGYQYRYVYDMPSKKSRVLDVVNFCKAAQTKASLRRAKIGMMGYRDMNLYGTLYDGPSLKRIIGPEIETFEMLEIEQRFAKVPHSIKRQIVETHTAKWQFTEAVDRSLLEKGAGYYKVLSQLAASRGYEAISLKDVDGMKKLLGFPPAMIFMLLSDVDGISTVPENDALGLVTQLIIRGLTGQIGAYLEFYEFMEDRVLAGVPDYIPAEITDGDTIVTPAAFGELDGGVLNVSRVKPGKITLLRLGHTGKGYRMHMVQTDAVSARKWEEAGWSQPAPQLPGLEILIDRVDDFAQNVLSQHYFLAYGDHVQAVRDLCRLLGIELCITS